MFICSLRPKAIVKKLLFLAVIAAAVFLLLTLLKISSRQENDPGSIPQASQTHETEAPNNLARITFLKSYGWEVSEEPSEVVSVVIPQTFGDVYENYNAIQTAQGFDLSGYRGKEVRRYTYEVLNYPGQKDYIRANLLIYRGKVIGGDICSVELNGFIHGFVNPNDTASLTQVSPGEGTASGEEAASPEAAASQAGEAAADPDATADASAAEGGQQTALETTSSQEPKYPVESSTERETLAPDPEMPNAPVD